MHARVNMDTWNIFVYFLLAILIESASQTVVLPSFQKLLYNYPGYKHYGGKFSHKRLLQVIACEKEHLLRDTSALRLSLTLNKIGDEHSLGRTMIKLSKYGQDSVTGAEGLQYMYHPLAYGPFLVDKYGYPNISVLHQTDLIATKDKFWGKQGIIEIITFTKKGNKPKGHIALWDCDHIHQAKDWFNKRTLITVEFWASPDSDCSHMKIQKPTDDTTQQYIQTKPLKTRRRQPLKANGRYSSTRADGSASFPRKRARTNIQGKSDMKKYSNTVNDINKVQRTEVTKTHVPRKDNRHVARKAKTHVHALNSDHVDKMATRSHMHKKKINKIKMKRFKKASLYKTNQLLKIKRKDFKKWQKLQSLNEPSRRTLLKHHISHRFKRRHP